MYWIYLIIFTFIVFVPTAIREGFYGFNAVQTQEFAMLILGSLGFIIFLLQEKLLKSNMAEKTVIQRKVNRMAKDLNSSYSYIGEINRKLDILENIALGYPESLNLTARRQKEMYDATMDAIRLFGKSDEFALRFICLPSHDIVKEIKSSPNIPINFSCKNIDSEMQIFESDEFFVATSPKAIDNIYSCIVIRKKMPAHKIEDLEVIKMLAAQALFMFMFINRKKEFRCEE